MLQAVNLRTAAFAAAILALCALAGRVQAQGQAQPQAPATPAAAPAAAPDLGGTYKCQPNPDPCLWPGASPSITQSGKSLQIKGDNGATADATLTSDATISAAGTFNSLGIIRPDHSIDWSDGTKWTKQ
jgi:hypothetical protein